MNPLKTRYSLIVSSSAPTAVVILNLQCACVLDAMQPSYIASTIQNLRKANDVRGVGPRSPDRQLSFDLCTNDDRLLAVCIGRFVIELITYLSAAVSSQSVSQCCGTQTQKVKSQTLKLTYLCIPVV